MGVTDGAGVGDLAKNYHSSGAAIDAESTAGADIFVNNKRDVVAGVLTR